jgi:hypothetical protein
MITIKNTDDETTGFKPEWKEIREKMFLMAGSKMARVSLEIIDKNKRMMKICTNRFCYQK